MRRKYLVPALRNSDKCSNTRADRIVQRACGDILNREPGRTGMEFYRKNIVEQNWSGKTGLGLPAPEPGV